MKTEEQISYSITCDGELYYQEYSEKAFGSILNLLNKLRKKYPLNIWKIYKQVIKIDTIDMERWNEE